jgi:hypothetical protein
MPLLNQNSVPIQTTHLTKISCRYLFKAISYLYLGFPRCLGWTRDPFPPHQTFIPTHLTKISCCCPFKAISDLNIGFPRYLGWTRAPLPSTLVRQTFKQPISWKSHAAVPLKQSHICVGFPQCLGWTRALSPPHQLDRHSNNPSHDNLMLLSL